MIYSIYIYIYISFQNCFHSQRSDVVNQNLYICLKFSPMKHKNARQLRHVSVIASEMTGNSIVYSISWYAHNNKNIKALYYWPPVKGIQQSRGDFSHRGPVIEKHFYITTSSTCSSTARKQHETYKPRHRTSRQWVILCCIIAQGVFLKCATGCGNGIIKEAAESKPILQMMNELVTQILSPYE